MDYARSAWSSSQDQNMYDDQPYADERRRSSPSQGYQNFRKDERRTPPRGRTSEGAYNSAYAERTHRGDRYAEEKEDYEYSGPPRRDTRREYTDRDREGYRSPRGRSRSRSRSPYYGGPPSRNVILEGLPVDITQEDILNELQHSLRVEGLEEVRLIRDKKTGLPRQFAFAQFSSIPEAKRFLERYYPTVPLYGAYDPAKSGKSEPNKVRVAYSREKDERVAPGRGEDDWKCEVCSLANYSHRSLCFRCNAPRTRATAHGVLVAQANVSGLSGSTTTGDSDASPDNTPSQFLLFRGLEPGVNEELLAKGVSKLLKTRPVTPPTDKQSNKKKIASTSSDAGLGAKEGSLRRVLLIRDRKSNESWRYGFAEFNSADDAQAAIAKYKAAEKFTIASKPVMVSYIHAGVFVPVLQQLAPEFERFTFSPLSNPAMKLVYWDDSGYACELVTAAPAPQVSVKNRSSEHAKLAVAAANEGLVDAGNEGEQKTKKRKIEKESAGGNSNKKVVAPHLQFWTNRHAELHGLPPSNEESTSIDGKSVRTEAEAAANIPQRQTFADLDRKCCLLCSRQFKTEAEVNKHERMSELHRENLKNAELVTKALSKLRKTLDKEESAYRDRAKERRQAFNQPKQPAPQQHHISKDTTKKKASAAEDEIVAAPSKGAALLGKMGWSAGEGLGAQGTGITGAITTQLYSQGVGLGAQGGKIGDALEEAHRQTKGSYADFLNKTKDKAKERFESLG